MDKLTQEAPQAFRGRFFNRGSSKPKEHRILALRTGLAGSQFYIENQAEREALDSIKSGTELLLYREPENKYDEWAIAVYLTEDDKIGFVSKFKNETIARLMDAGKKFVAVVDDPQDAPENTSRSRQAPTENMAIPFSVYLVEEN